MEDTKMDPKVKEAIFLAVQREPLAQTLKLELVALEKGRSVVQMTYRPEIMNNIYDRAHGGAIFALIDEAFETVSQTHGTVAVALNVNVTYLTSPQPCDRLQAEAQEISRSRKTANYEIKVTDSKGRLIATCQALAYRTGRPIPFLS